MVYTIIVNYVIVSKICTTDRLNPFDHTMMIENNSYFRRYRGLAGWILLICYTHIGYGNIHVYTESRRNQIVKTVFGA